MIKYFCECCGSEMNNKESKQITFYAKNVRDVEELKTDAYSQYDEDFKVCNSCSERIRGIILNGCFEDAPTIQVIEAPQQEEQEEEYQPTFIEMALEILEYLGRKILRQC